MRICSVVAARPATTGSMGTPARLYSSVRLSDSAQKCGGVHRNTIRNRMIGSRPMFPVEEAQPTTGGSAPAAPPMTMFCGVCRFSHRV
jgi:hypothetical protein